MCRGAQHPIRGLFLRAYLLQSIDRTLLPDRMGLKYEKIIGQSDNRNEDDLNVYDSIGFILANFVEMNKLWVRMQFQGLSKEKMKREKEREELCTLVGANLTRLSQLESIDFVLPHILTQITQCRDKLAQEYLLEIITQVFPDEFHLATMDEIFQACMEVVPEVKIRKIVCSLIDRLCLISANKTKNKEDLDFPYLKDIFVDLTKIEDPEWRYIQEKPFQSCSNEFKNEMTVIAYLAQQIGKLLWFIKAEQLNSEGVYPSDIAIIYHHLTSMALYLINGKSSHYFIDYCLNCSAIFLRRIGFDCLKSHSALTKDVIALLKLPLDGGPIGQHCDPKLSLSGRFTSSNCLIPLTSLCTVNDIFKMPGYSSLVNLLDPKTSKRHYATQIMKIFREKNHFDSKLSKELDETRVVTDCQLDGLLNLIGILVSTEYGYYQMTSRIDEDDELQIEEMALISGCIHLIGMHQPKSLEDCQTNFEFLEKTSSSLIQFTSAKAKENKEKLSLQMNIPEADLIVSNAFPAIIFQLNQNLSHYNMVQQTDFNKEELENWENGICKTITLIHSCIKRLINANVHEKSIRLLLDTAIRIDEIDFKKRSTLVYEFISHAIVLSEDGGIDSKAQNSSLTSIISTLKIIQNLDEESYNILRKQCYRASNHLLRKLDQAKAIMLTTKLYWNFAIDKNEDQKHKIRDDEQIKILLGKVLTISDECMGACVQVQLKIDVLNLYLNYKSGGYEEIQDSELNDLIRKIFKLIKQCEIDSSSLINIRYLQNTINFIKFKNEENPELFKGIDKHEEILRMK